jgi:hypothetical protein
MWQREAFAQNPIQQDSFVCRVSHVLALKSPPDCAFLKLLPAVGALSGSGAPVSGPGCFTFLQACVFAMVVVRCEAKSIKCRYACVVSIFMCMRTLNTCRDAIWRLHGLAPKRYECPRRLLPGMSTCTSLVLGTFGGCHSFLGQAVNTYTMPAYFFSCACMHVSEHVYM